MRGSRRLFVALYPPGEISRELQAALADLKLPAYSPTPVEQVHLTLQFIGDTAERELAGVVESVAAACAGLRTFALKRARLVRLPERGLARVLAVETDAPAELREIHRRLVVRLARNAKKDDGFLPHLTLGRFSGAGREMAELSHPLDGPAFTVTRIALVQSVLRNDGAEHRVLEWFDLSASG